VGHVAATLERKGGSPVEFTNLSRVPFSGRILMLGCGSVAQCTLPLLLRHVVQASQITVMDFVDNRSRIQTELDQGVTYVVDRVERHNMGDVLSKYVSDGDILINLAWNIDANEILQWCHDAGVRYLDTSVEVWEPYVDASAQDPRDRSLYVRHMAMRKMMASWTKPGPTAVLEHGANPGLVSHLVKDALDTIAKRAIAEGKIVGAQKDRVVRAQESRSYNHLAMELGVKVIHIAERDTQISDKPKEVGEFVNTWSVEGLYEEGVAPAELGWGTHERRMPDGAYVHQSGPSHQLALARMGMDTWVRSWTPLGEIHGMVIRHGEAFSIPEHLTVWDGLNAIYRPTVHYAYCPTDAALASLHELRANHLVMPDRSRQRIMNNEILPGGSDAMGILLMGHPYRSWWTGSVLTIDQARALIPGQSATTVQVAVSVMAAIVWMIENPDRGVCLPDDLDHERIIELAKPYLGTYYSEPVDWSPLDNRAESTLFAQFNRPTVAAHDPEEEWQFTTFLV
jgi:homospermidine synthase